MSAVGLKGQKVLVVGATGMVATPIVRHLAKGNEIWAAARFKDSRAREQLEAEGVHTVTLDLSDPDLAGSRTGSTTS